MPADAVLAVYHCPAGHARFSPAAFDAFRATYLDKWEGIYAEWREAMRTRLPEGPWDNPDKKRMLHAINEEFRARLLGERTYGELAWPGHGSPLLLDAAAVYAVNHRLYYDRCDGDPSWKPPSLGFAWNVACLLYTSPSPRDS